MPRRRAQPVADAPSVAQAEDTPDEQPKGRRLRVDYLDEVGSREVAIVPTHPDDDMLFTRTVVMTWAQRGYVELPYSGETVFVPWHRVLRVAELTT